MVLNILRSRKFARRVLLGVLILIIPAFVLWGVGNIGSGPELLGTIGKQKIYADDLAESMQGIKIQILFSYYSNSEALNQMLRNRPMLMQMAWERLILLSAARKKGYKVSNKDIVAFIAQHPLFSRDGAFDKEVYDNILRNYLGLGPRQFEEYVRENLQVTGLRDEIIKDVSVSEEDALKFYKMTNDKVELSFLVVGTSMFADRVSVSEDDAKKFYEENKDRIVQPEKVEIEYIEFPYENATEKRAVVEEMEKIYPELQEYPTRLAAVAEKYNRRHDTTGEFSREDVIPGIPFFQDFHVMAFAMTEGEISPPVFSAEDKGAAYILRKIKVVPPKSKSFEESKEEITAFLTERGCFELARDKADELYEKMTQGGFTLEGAGFELKQQVSKAGPMSINYYIDNVGPAEQIVYRALEAGEGAVMPPVMVQRGFFLGRVDKVIPADEAEFDKNRELIQRNLLARKQMAAMDKWLKENEVNAHLKKPLNML